MKISIRCPHFSLHVYTLARALLLNSWWPLIIALQQIHSAISVNTWYHNVRRTTCEKLNSRKCPAMQFSCFLVWKGCFGSHTYVCKRIMYAFQLLHAHAVLLFRSENRRTVHIIDGGSCLGDTKSHSRATH